MAINWLCAFFISGYFLYTFQNFCRPANSGGYNQVGNLFTIVMLSSIMNPSVANDRETVKWDMTGLWTYLLI